MYTSGASTLAVTRRVSEDTSLGELRTSSKDPLESYRWRGTQVRVGFVESGWLPESLPDSWYFGAHTMAHFCDFYFNFLNSIFIFLAVQLSGS